MDIIFTVENETPLQRCELCGVIAETRPYGLNHEEICIDCAKKDEAVTLMRMNDCMYVEIEN